MLSRTMPWALLSLVVGCGEGGVLQPDAPRTVTVIKVVEPYAHWDNDLWGYAVVETRDGLRYFITGQIGEVGDEFRASAIQCRRAPHYSSSDTWYAPKPAPDDGATSSERKVEWVKDQLVRCRGTGATRK